LLFPPLEPATPIGLEVICNEATSDYTSTGSDDADSYEWMLEPEEAGNIIFEGLDATVEWNTDFNGIAMISLYGINDCGEGNPSNVLEVSVGAPNPVIEGESLVCDWSDEMYEVADNAGSTYTWETEGGAIADGQGSNLITVSWEGEGVGSVIVTEVTSGGCEGYSEIFEVTIDDCTEIPQHNETTIYIFPNPANDYLIIHSVDMIQKIGLFNLEGAEVLNIVETGKSARIITKALNPGVYFLKIQTVNNILTKKILIQ
jgi:hypothetical protein